MRDTQPITETKTGPVPAILVSIDGKYNYWLVVKTKPLKQGATTNSTPVPVRDNLGRLVYAVPGGGSYVPPAP